MICLIYLQCSQSSSGGYAAAAAAEGGNGDQKTQTRSTRPERRATTAGHTHQTKADRRSERKAAGETQAQEPEKPERREPRPQERGGHRRTHRPERTGEPGSQDQKGGTEDTNTGAANRDPSPGPRSEQRRNQKSNKEHTPKNKIAPLLHGYSLCITIACQGRTINLQTYMGSP